MRAFLCEFPWQVEPTLQAKVDSDMLVSLDPSVSYEFFRRGISFIESSEICQHKALWSRYQQFTTDTLNLTDVLDGMLWEADRRFHEMEWRFFDSVHYVLKICYDQLIYIGHLVCELREQHGVRQFVCADLGAEPSLDEYGLFDPDSSLVRKVLDSLLEFDPNIHIIAQVPPVYQLRRNSKSYLSFGQPRSFFVQYRCASYLLNKWQFLKSAFGRWNKNCSVVAVGCKEVDALVGRQDGPDLGITHYNRFHSLVSYSKSWSALGEFEVMLNTSQKFRELCAYREVSFSNLLKQVILYYAVRLEKILSECQQVAMFLDQCNPAVLLFQTLAPLYPPNIYAHWWCNRNRVPYACWMHGGYGGNYSLAGYDVVDYRRCKHHLAYGAHVKELVSDPRCILNNLISNVGKSKIYIAGTPYFERLYAGRSPKRLPGSKMRILFAFGNNSIHNQFYFGYNRPESEFSIWKAHYEIIKALVPFQDRYEVILKDYPQSRRKKLWMQVLNDNGGNKLQYVTGRVPFQELVKTTDVHIFVWMSTTFMQSMFSEADVFLYENGDVSQAAQEKLERGAFFSSDLPIFINMLTAYLSAGDFFQKDKSEMRDYFMDFSNREQRIQQFQNVMSEIKNSEVLSSPRNAQIDIESGDQL